MAFSYYQTTFHGPQTKTLWPDTNTSQMDINRGLLRNDFLHPMQAQQNSSLMIPYQHIKNFDHLFFTTGYSLCPKLIAKNKGIVEKILAFNQNIIIFVFLAIKYIHG
jgi:hypothetical protein